MLTAKEDPAQSKDLVLLLHEMLSLLGKEILSQQVDKGSVDEKTGRAIVEDTNHDQTHLTLGIIRVSAGNSNSLSDRSCAAESKDEQPRSDTALGIRNSSDTRSETETLKHLMEHDGNEENEETVSGHGDGHTDKDGVEEDTTFEKGDVHRHALESLLVNRVVLLIKVRLADFGVGLGVDGSLRVLGLLDHLNHLGALSDVLLVKDDEPGGHGRVAVVFGIGVGALFLLVHLTSHGLFVAEVAEGEEEEGR
ncbi:hypothetical protein HG531_000746 [Fusarium graminearum]|nr:hypothetical protein HG531_000746 [Fusarium graminearum]